MGFGRFLSEFPFLLGKESFGRVLGGFWAKVLGGFWAKVLGESFGRVFFFALGGFWAKILGEFSFLLWGSSGGL